MNAADFTSTHRARAQAARVASAALRAGDPGPASALLGSWRFASDPAYCGAFLAHLARALLAFGLRRQRVWLGEHEPMDHEVDRPSRMWIRELEGGAELDDPSDPLAAALAALAWWGGEIHELERGAFADRVWSASPRRDAEAAALWAQWFTGDLAAVYRRWQPTFWPVARRALRAALVTRAVPDHRYEQIRDETEESFFALFIGRKGETPGWREVAVRLVETGHSDGPITALATLVEPGRWPVFFRCAERRQPWRGTTARLELDQQRVSSFPDRIAAEPARLEALVDLHTAHRLVRAWRHGPATELEASWRVVRHHRHRVRGRLRALVRDQPGNRLSDALFGLDALFARTEFAVGAFMWGWAQAELKYRFPIETRLLTPACVIPDAPVGRDPRTDTDAVLDMERSWVGLVYLRGKQDLLNLYLVQPSCSNGTFGELLSLLPPAVADPGVVRNRTWRGLRRSLRHRSRGYVDQLDPMFVALAGLDPKDRGLKARALAILDEHLHPDIPRPSGGFPKMVLRARELRRGRGDA